MGIKFTNNATTSLVLPVSAGDTVLTVANGNVFPEIEAGDYTYVTLETSSFPLSREVVRVIGRSSNVLTVVRGQDNTTARSFVIGDRVELRVTASALTDLDHTQANYFKPGDTFDFGSF